MILHHASYLLFLKCEFMFFGHLLNVAYFIKASISSSNPILILLANEKFSRENFVK